MGVQTYDSGRNAESKKYYIKFNVLVFTGK